MQVAAVGSRRCELRLRTPPAICNAQPQSSRDSRPAGAVDGLNLKVCTAQQ